MGTTVIVSGMTISSASPRKATLFYSPVDLTDESDLHQTVVKFIG